MTYLERDLEQLALRVMARARARYPQQPACQQAYVRGYYTGLLALLARGDGLVQARLALIMSQR